MSCDACVFCEGLRGVVDVGEDLCGGLCKVVGNGTDLDIRQGWCGRDEGRWGVAVSVPRVGDAVDRRHVGDRGMDEGKWGNGELLS